METLSNDTVHASTSIAPNNAHIDVQNIDELSKEKEEELLYGTGEDGDEEEALSDDSLRLRLSDDEGDIEDITPVSVNTTHCNQEITDMNEESKEECTVNIQPCNETSKMIGSNKKNINCKGTESILNHANLTETEDVICDIKISCNDSKDSKNSNNLTAEEKEHESSIEAQNGEVDINKENDQCHNTKQDSELHTNEELLDNDCNITIIDHKKVQNSTLDKHSEVDENCENQQEINCTQTIGLDQCKKNNDSAVPTSKNMRSSVVTNGKSKTIEENCLDTDEKVNNTKSDKKVIDKEDDVCQIQNHCLRKQTEKSNSAKVISESSEIQNTDQSVPEAINVDSDINETVVSTDEISATSRATSLESITDIKSDDNEKKDAEISKTKRRRRSRKLSLPELGTIQENKQGIEVGRQKRRTAKNAEEIIRKKFLVQDSDVESSDSAEKIVVVNHKISQHMQPLSPPSLKRNCPDTEAVIVNGNTKRQKRSTELLNENITIKENNKNDIKGLSYIHKFFRRDLKEKLPKLKQEELEELLIQKIVETITMRGEIGRLREQARISEKSQEATRTRCQQLAKQIKDFEMVLSRNAADRRANNDKPTPPIKINRSVGLQVNFITDHGIQSLRQLQQNSPVKSVNVPTSNNTPASVNSVVNETNNNASNPRKGIKVRSPRRLETPIAPQPVTISQSCTQLPPLISTVTPAALVVSKTVESQHSVSLQNQTNSIQQILPNQQQSLQPQTVVLNGKIPHQTNRQSTAHNVSKPKTNDLIDLTDEEEKGKSTSKNKPALTITAVTTSTITDQSGNIISKAQPCFPRVIQALPANVAITSQPASIRVVHTASHPTPTALVNNMNAPRLAYVMQSGVGTGRQLLITSSSNQIRPVTPCTRPPFTTTLAYKAGISTNANGTVRVITTSAGPNVQLNKHPAPLPDSPHYAINSASKLPPPAPSLKISKVANGIVLSWNMTLSDKYADIVSYQLYAYQEVAGVPPSTNLWKKVGDVRALPLPMACTLTQFSEGNNYYFAVRAVDTHSRKGQYSAPGNISL
ncbi:hypothetical protein KPH14_003866 [Odynerus spinipes]|uniref:Fibronectin type-III domain-containing protein n=1 Tax=Odynerus spinipes TaxID=1348599 RepID=A0AAD9RY68_9HYME|nr:hypothetical protein KPH14_003866 [Odynerus spinipes]